MALYYCWVVQTVTANYILSNGDWKRGICLCERVDEQTKNKTRTQIGDKVK
jgi:hypothetical protein